MSSSIDPGRSGLAVVLDIRHPFSYLALAPAFEFADETGVDVEWLPIRAHTLVEPSTPKPDDDRGIRHRRARAQMIAREIAVYAEAQGLRIEAPYRDGGAEAFHTAWLWVKDSSPDALRRFLEEAFRRYWARDLDPAEHADAVRLVEKLGLDVERFRNWAASHGSTALETAASALADAGVNQGPAYIVNSEVFYGRQHLPMISWLLAGGNGERPI